MAAHSLQQIPTLPTSKNWSATALAFLKAFNCVEKTWSSLAIHTPSISRDGAVNTHYFQLLRSGLPLLLLRESPPTPMAEGPRLAPASFFFFMWKGKISPLWITPGSSVKEMMVSRGGPGSGLIFLGFLIEESARSPPILELLPGRGFVVLLLLAFKLGLLP